MPKSDRKFCIGCREDFYNGEGAAECWSRKSAKVVTRWKLGWWTPPTQPAAFQEVRTHQCHSAPGQFAFYEKLPTFAKDPIRLRKTDA